MGPNSTKEKKLLSLRGLDQTAWLAEAEQVLIELEGIMCKELANHKDTRDERSVWSGP